MRVLMYSPDSIGLGHMRRNATIGAELVRQCPDASVALIIGSGAGAFFSVPKGIDTIKIPSVQKVTADVWKSRSLNLSTRDTVAMRAGIISNVICMMKPDLLLVDHLPMGVCEDLLPALDVIRSERLPTRVVLGLRDILDEPSIIRRRWTNQGQYGLIADHYDAVLIYGDPDIYPSGTHYGLDGCLPGKIHYTGYVCSTFEAARDTRGNPQVIPTLAGLGAWKPGERIIVAAGGGGHDAYPALSATLDALAGFDQDPTIRSVIIAGPLMPDGDRLRLEERARGLRQTTLVPWTADCLDYLSAADIAVVMAGYNSSLEALSTRARIIMIPREGPSAEQRIRAQLLSASGHVDCIEPKEANSGTVARAIQVALQAPPREPASGLLDGARIAARKLIELAKTSGPREVRTQPQPVRSPYVVF